MEKCTPLLHEFQDGFFKLLDDHLEDGRERGVRLLRDKQSGEIITWAACIGDECKVSLPKINLLEFEDIGSFHTHGPYDLGLSTGDVLVTLNHNEELTCVAAAPPVPHELVKTFFEPTGYEGKKVIKCYINDIQHPLFRSLHQKFQARKQTPQKATREENDFIMFGWNTIEIPESIRAEKGQHPLWSKGYKNTCMVVKD